jgi:hypothetical protein
MDPLTPLLILVPLLLLNSKTKSTTSSSDGKYKPKSQPEFKNQLDNILTTLEPKLEIQYLRDFLMGAAYVESRYFPSAITYEKLDNDTWNNIKKLYKTNKYISQKNLWEFTAGLVQLFPSTALKTADGKGINNSPLTVFDPHYNIAYAIDYASRLNKYHDAVRWFDIRLGWASLQTLKNKEPNKVLAVEGRIVNGIEKSGGNPEILYEYLPNNFDKYRSQYGFKKTLDLIKTIA